MAFITSHNGKYTLYCVVRVNSVSLAHKYTHTAAENLCVYVSRSHEFLKTHPLQKTQPAEEQKSPKLGQFALNYAVYLFIYSKRSLCQKSSGAEMEKKPSKSVQNEK